MEDVTLDTAAMDSIYKHDIEEQKTLLTAKPWAAEYSRKSSALLTFKSPLLQKDPHFSRCTHQNGFTSPNLCIVLMRVGDACTLGWEYRDYGVDAG